MVRVLAALSIIFMDTISKWRLYLALLVVCATGWTTTLVLGYLGKRAGCTCDNIPYDSLQCTVDCGLEILACICGGCLVALFLWCAVLKPLTEYLCDVWRATKGD